ncbi:MAG TPA: ABC transporter ATP-binding protein [Parvularculaceae bacterium]|mgnify:CR=1 FL=1|nr:ABC transporter ATP-binding protein [Parvularculaceae bacterium]HNS86279.1 ABC transporter ATP-binding protein [Parvularculaceae bacterium]
MASITLEDVGVHYLLPQARSAGLLNSVRSLAMGGVVRRNQGRIGVTAIDGVSFDLRDGDRLGLIGHNGAGKTTLLRVLAGILPPTSGRIAISGRVSALMSIHLGLDSYASGYDNIRIRARYMGCSEDEIAASFDEIVAFSGLDDYLALPIRTYSAGMRLRLAFSVATAFNPDILILDEWLSAGDEAFQTKARDRLVNLIDRTGIFAFASHSSSLQKRMCNKGMVLLKGRVAFFGDVEEALDFHKAAQASA